MGIRSQYGFMSNVHGHILGFGHHVDIQTFVGVPHWHRCPRMGFLGSGSHFEKPSLFFWIRANPQRNRGLGSMVCLLGHSASGWPVWGRSKGQLKQETLLKDPRH